MWYAVNLINKAINLDDLIVSEPDEPMRSWEEQITRKDTMKNPTRHKGVIIEAESEKLLWTCGHLHAAMAGAKRCASRQRDRLFKVSSKNVLAHDSQRT